MTNKIAIRNQKLDLFTSEKNVDMQVVNEIVDYMKNVKKIKVTKPQKFEVTVFAYNYFTKLNLDTLMYFVEHYNFKDLELSTIDMKVKVSASKRIRGTNYIITVGISTEHIEFNLLPNDIKEIIQV